MSFEVTSIERWSSRLRGYLFRQRYAKGVIQRYVAVGRCFLIHLRQRSIDIEHACPEDVNSYLKTRLHDYGKRHAGSPRNLSRWRTHLTSGIHILLRLVQGQWPPEPNSASEAETLRRKICGDYFHWLTEVRGLSPQTIANRYAAGFRFLTWLGDKSSSKQKLRMRQVPDIDSYLRQKAPMLRRPTRKQLAICLRCFLRYLHREGLIERELSFTVKSPSLYAFESIPSAFQSREVTAILETAQKDRTPLGRRDYAILMLLSVYGLRAGEVVALSLDDVDWRHESIKVRHSKTGRESVLPLVSPVADAILKYLRYGRPQTEARAVFIRAQAPYRGFHDGSSLYGTVTRRIKAAGIQPLGKHGPHAFRHARAVSLIRASVPVKMIADILGHKASSSTAIYLKLATADLRSVGLDVPEEVTP